MAPGIVVEDSIEESPASKKGVSFDAVSASPKAEDALVFLEKLNEIPHKQLLKRDSGGQEVCMKSTNGQEIVRINCLLVV